MRFEDAIKLIVKIYLKEVHYISNVTDVNA